MTVKIPYVDHVTGEFMCAEAEVNKELWETNSEFRAYAAQTWSRQRDLSCLCPQCNFVEKAKVQNEALDYQIAYWKQVRERMELPLKPWWFRLLDWWLERQAKDGEKS